MCESSQQKLSCTECDYKHNDSQSFCRECGACLYENSIQVKDNQYPLFRCTKCDTVNFWD